MSKIDLNFGADEVRIEPWNQNIDVYITGADDEAILDTIGKERVIEYFQIEEADNAS